MVTEANSGKNAVEHTAIQPFDLILMDVPMPAYMAMSWAASLKKDT